MEEKMQPETPINNTENLDEQTTEIEYFDILIVTPNGTVVSLTVGPDEVVQDVKQSLLETVETCFLTCYHLEFNDMELFDYISIGDIPELSAGETWTMVEDEYCVRSSRSHVLRCVDLFDLVEEDKGGVFRDLVKDKNLDEGVRVGDVGDEAKFVVFFPASRKRDTCVKSIGFSGWNPVPNYRKLQGDLFYLDITTLENVTVSITASAKGFFVNKCNGNNFDPTIKDDRLFAQSLPELFTKISNNFSVNFSKLLTQNLETLALDNIYLPLPKTNWVAKPTRHSFNVSRSERSLSEMQTVEHNIISGKTREWNKEIQTVKELEIDTTDARITKIRENFRVNSDFIEEAIKGAVEIVDGNVPPFNPADNKLSEMYIYNNIFFSYAVDGRTYYPDLEPEKFAYKKASNDLLGVKEFNSINFKEIHTLGTVIVDYRGYRLVAQSIIPGLFDETPEEEDNSSRIKYGSLDTKIIQCDEEFDTLMAQAAEKLHIKKRTIVSEENEVVLHAHADIKGIEGSDSRKYILDVNRLTPRDANYPNPETHAMAILRPELIPQYIYHLTTEKRNAIEDEELKAQVELVTITFNTDLLTDIKLVETESTAEELADLNGIAAYLKDLAIPKFVEDCASFNLSLSDGDDLKESLHNRGINLRYLGTIGTLAEGKSRFLFRLCLVEMICRTTKHIFDSILRDVPVHEVAEVVTNLLNCFFSRQSTSSRPSKSGVNVPENEEELSHNSLWKEIREKIQRSYQFSLPESIPAFVFQLPVLRNLCKRNGFQLFAKNIDFTKSKPFSVDLISSVFPTYKHCIVASGDGHTYLETGKTYLLSRRYDIAFECFQESLAIFHQTYGPMHKAVAECYAWMARILSLFDNPNEALEHQEKAVVIYERVLGLDHSETAQAYLLLASFTYDMDAALAINYYKRALYLQTLIGANTSPEISSTLVLVGTIKQENGDKSAEDYYLRALESSKDIFGENSVATARMYHQLAAFSSAKGDFRGALNFEQKNWEILQANVKEDDYSLIESSIWLKQLTENAINTATVPPRKMGRKTRTKKETNEGDWEREIISQLPAQDLVNYISNPNVGSSSSFAKWAQKKQNRKANVLKKTTQETTEDTISLVKNANNSAGKRKRRRNKK